MKTLAYLYATILAIFVVAYWSTISFAAGPIKLIESGYSRSFNNGQEKIEPLWSIIFGDTSKGRHSASVRYGFDGTAWVHFQKGWRSVSFRRSQVAAEESGDFTEIVRDVKIGGTELLPRQFAKLTPGELALIDYIIGYELGGIQAFLMSGTPMDEAKALFYRLEETNKDSQ